MKQRGRLEYGEEGEGCLLNELKAASKPSSDYKRQAFSEISQKSGRLDRFMGMHTPLVFILQVYIYEQRLKAKTNV